MIARIILGAACILTAARCAPSPPKESVAARAQPAAETVFETPQPYSTDTITEAQLSAFFKKHAEFRADSSAIAGFYRRRGMQYAWILGDSLSAGAESFIAFAGVADTAAHNSAFAAHLVELYEQSADGTRPPECDGCDADLEIHLTAEYFRLASRHYGAYLTRDARGLNWFIPRAKKDLNRLVDSIAAGKMDLSAYEPTHPQYELLKQRITAYRKIPADSWPALQLPKGRRKFVQGDSSAIIGEIRRRLRVFGDVQDDNGGAIYDGSLADGVKRFQSRHGLHADAIIGTSFLKAVNVSPTDRVRTMLVNIERLRWIPEEQPPNLLLVNIPEYHLHVFENGQEVMNMEVVVGKRATRTVIFSDTLSQIVFSPSWGVPASITRNEILPGIAKDPDYLAKHDMEIVGGTKDLPQIRQRPGPSNPLGGAKFLFPNSYDIYMHDTPAKSLFANETRTGSHGCIRLSRARDFAEYLLKNDPEWPPDRILQAMTSGRETTVRLKEKRPVTIGYFTAWVAGDGSLHFREDVYGHDAKLARELFAQ